jgi:hypothetical protein
MLQHIENDIRRASLLLYLGYKMNRAVTDTQGIQWFFENPGDIEEAIKSYDEGAQVADARKLIESYDDLLKQAGSAPVMSEGKVELMPTSHPDEAGRVWRTRDTLTATLLQYSGYKLLSAELNGNGKIDFSFAWDEALTDIVSKFNRDQLLVSPKNWSLSSFSIREEMRNAKQRHQSLPVSLSSNDEAYRL